MKHVFKARRRFAAAAWVAVIPAASTLLMPFPSGAYLRETVMIAMRDGVELATEVYRPDTQPAPSPVLMRRTPYGRALADEDMIGGLLLSGYVIVSQDVRGRGDSEGNFIPFSKDGPDGYDTIDWIVSQEWCDGKVGSFGASAEGIDQLMTAGEGHPALMCAHVGVATGDIYEGFMPGGAWRTELTTEWLLGLGEPEALAVYRAHEAGDSFWDPMRLDSTERGRVAIPILLYGGFFDIFAVGTPRTHRLLQQEASAAARDSQFLVLGPWRHTGVTATEQGEVAFPADAAYTAYGAEFLAFFRWCLKDEPRPDLAAVRYYVMDFDPTGSTATGEWRTADSWPPSSTSVTLYMHDDGTLDGDAPDDVGAPAVLPVDPYHPIPSIGGGNLSTAAGPHDQSGIDGRSDVMVAQTFAVMEEVEVAGDVTARVYASSATTDVDVIVRLSVVTAGGKPMLIADGIRRGRFVDGFEEIRPLSPGAPAAFDVDVGPVAFVLRPGYGLRVAVSGTSSPRYEPNPGVAEPLSAGPTPVTTTLTVMRDAGNASHVVLPVVRGAIPAVERLDEGGEEIGPVEEEGERSDGWNEPVAEAPDTPDTDDTDSADGTGDATWNAPEENASCGCLIAAGGGDMAPSFTAALFALAFILRYLSRRRRASKDDVHGWCKKK